MTEFHADDYGLFPKQSKRILRCITEGACNGISIMPNSPYLSECMEMLARSGVSTGVADSGQSDLIPGQQVSEQPYKYL